METTKSTRKAVAELVSALSKKMPLSISEQFLANIKEEYKELPLPIMLSGAWTVKQQFSIIKKALKDLQLVDEIRDNIDLIPWQDLTFIMLSFLEDNMSRLNQLENSSIHKTEPSPVKSKVTANHKVPSTKRTGEAMDGTIKSSKPIKANPPLTHTIKTTDEIEHIQKQLIMRLDEDVHPYGVKANRYVKCDKKDCAFCYQMYINLDLTACAMFGHSPCTSVGYFPHVGISMWKVLRKQHDEKQKFKPKQEITRKPGDLPRLSESAHLAQRKSATATSSPTRKRATSEAPTTNEKIFVRESSVPLTWSEQVIAENL